MYCNGARLNGQFMKDVVDAGIDFIRVSVIGYNKNLYKKWMNIDNFELILSTKSSAISPTATATETAIHLSPADPNAAPIIPSTA